jgi:hypothetical protein
MPNKTSQVDIVAELLPVEVLTKENTSNFSQFWRVVAKYDWVRKHT